MAVNHNIVAACTVITGAEKYSTALLRAGAHAAAASYSRDGIERYVRDWLVSIGLGLPEMKQAPSTRGRPSKKGAKVVKLPVTLDHSAERSTRDGSKITRDKTGKVTRITLSIRRQSELINTMTRGLVDWYSKQEGVDYTGCVSFASSARPMVSKKKEVLAMGLRAEVIQRIATAITRMQSPLKRMGIAITLPGQSTKTTKGGRKPSAKAASEKDTSLRMVNAMAPREAYAYCIKHGMSEKALVKLAQYVVDNIARAA